MRYGAHASIAILIIVAIVLGYLIENQFVAKKVETQQTPQPSTAQNQDIPISTPASDSVSKAIVLTEDEQAALNTPGTNATEEERKKYFDIAVRAAKYAAVLDIAQCHGNPVVLRVQAKQTLVVNNPDSVSHTIVIDKDHEYTIPANEKKDIVIDFGKGGGLYGYGCDLSQKTNGLFLVGQ